MTCSGGSEAGTFDAYATQLPPDSLQYTGQHWAWLRDATIPPGETFEIVVSGHVTNTDVDTVTLQGTVSDAATGRWVPDFSFSAPVTPRFDDVAGTVFGDANGNARYDLGEGLAGVTLRWHNYYHPDYSVHEVTTSAHGQFSVSLPTARFLVSAMDGTGGTPSAGG